MADPRPIPAAREHPAPWWQTAIIYQIYPRSFVDSDGDGVGDLRGIIDRLGYLAGDVGRALGVDAIWLSPFYPSPMADFGYDVADYTDVDPVFGTLADFDALVEAAHARGIRVILDWVPNHTSNQHSWFRESRSARDSARRDWYVWRDPAPGGGPPNNWGSQFGAVGCAWTLDEPTGQYYLHSFTVQQPDLNWDNPDVEAAMHDVLRFWLDRGADGFRLDAIHKLAKDPRFADNVPGQRRHDEDWPTIHDRLRGIRRVIDEYERRMIVGEVWLLDTQRVIDYVGAGDQLHLAHNFVFARLPWDASAFRGTVEEFEQLSAGAVWPAWFLENHDMSRVATRYAGGPGSGRHRARLAAMLVGTLRGTPFLYQGQELGLPDAAIPAARVYDVDGRDPERAPIPWRPPSVAGPGAGFTTGEPWLPIVDGAERLAADVQADDKDSMLAFVRALIRLRASTPALVSGAQRSLEAAAACFCYLRELDDRWLVALNFSSQRVAVGLADGIGASGVVRLSTHGRPAGRRLALGDLVLEGDEGIIAQIL